MTEMYIDNKADYARGVTELIAWSERDQYIKYDRSGDSDDTPGNVYAVSTLVRGPVMYAANIVTHADEDGYATDYRVEWFDDISKAEEALRNAPPPFLNSNEPPELSIQDWLRGGTVDDPRRAA